MQRIRSIDRSSRSLRSPTGAQRTEQRMTAARAACQNCARPPRSPTASRCDPRVGQQPARSRPAQSSATRGAENARRLRTRFRLVGGVAGTMSPRARSTAGFDRGTATARARESGALIPVTRVDVSPRASWEVVISSGGRKCASLGS